jgi:hypothetical protein
MKTKNLYFIGTLALLAACSSSNGPGPPAIDSGGPACTVTADPATVLGGIACYPSSAMPSGSCTGMSNCSFCSQLCPPSGPRLFYDCACSNGTWMCSLSGQDAVACPPATDASADVDATSDSASLLDGTSQDGESDGDACLVHPCPSATPYWNAATCGCSANTDANVDATSDIASAGNQEGQGNSCSGACCPFPTQGSACPDADDGQNCSTSVQCPGGLSLAAALTCTGGSWQIVSEPCPALDGGLTANGCPAQQPLSGTACFTSDGSGVCTYALTCTPSCDAGPAASQDASASNTSSTESATVCGSISETAEAVCTAGHWATEPLAPCP